MNKYDIEDWITFVKRLEEKNLKTSAIYIVEDVFIHHIPIKNPNYMKWVISLMIWRHSLILKIPN